MPSIIIIRACLPLGFGEWWRGDKLGGNGEICEKEIIGVLQSSVHFRSNIHLIISQREEFLKHTPHSELFWVALDRSDVVQYIKYPMGKGSEVTPVLHTMSCVLQKQQFASLSPLPTCCLFRGVWGRRKGLSIVIYNTVTDRSTCIFKVPDSY